MISLTSFDNAGMPEEKKQLTAEVEGAIHLIRGQRVMLDSDLAKIYGVTTKRLLQQFNRNRERFPEDFGFQLTREELAALRLQFATSNEALGSQDVTLKKGSGGRRYIPWAFTEHGTIMLATVLNSQVAIDASVQVVRAFVKLREMVMSSTALAVKLSEFEQRLDGHDEALQYLFQQIRLLLEPPADNEQKREIGFHVREGEKADNGASRTRDE